MSQKILVIDDEESFLRSIKRVLRAEGFQHLELTTKPSTAIELFKKGEIFDVALIDVTMPDMNGPTLLEEIKYLNPDTECIMVTAVDDSRTAVECIKKGAYDYLIKPVSREDLLLTINNALERKRFLDILHLEKNTGDKNIVNKEAFKSIVTKSEKVLRILKQAEIHAGSDVPILITGESGTGKELLARAIFKSSKRRDRPFTPVNMASLTSSLFDAEFFGYNKGAFTGADKDRQGYLEYTNGGTLFLDEIGIMPFDLQGKLLRVLQEGEYIKLGTNAPRKADIRFIASTNEQLDILMAKGQFRKDLFYRLKGAWLAIPPLRERKEDIPILASHFVEEFSQRSGHPGFKKDAMEVLYRYDYPGNIRELKSIVHSAANLSEGKSISRYLLPDPLQKIKPRTGYQCKKPDAPIMPLAAVEKDYILEAYEKTGKNKSQTAHLLDIALNTLRNKLRSYGVK